MGSQGEDGWDRAGQARPEKVRLMARKVVLVFKREGDPIAGCVKTVLQA